ncbi:MAG: NAD(P)H-dependent oxidoreductase [Dehalococcoidia bacterium]
MKITILNGNPNADNTEFDDYLKRLTGLLESAQHRVTVFQLRDMDVKYCTGCFDCWVKTPGQCKVTDDSHDICREYISSDFALFASPVIMGFTSALLKKANDKLVPLLPYHMEFVDNELHHVARYDNYPLTGLLLQKSDDTDEEDIRIISDIYRRDAINLKASLRLTRSTNDPVEEVANEINSV